MSVPPDLPAQLAGLVGELLAETPGPPPVDADPAEVLDLAVAVLEAVAPKLAILRGLVDNHGTVPEVAAQVRELHDRTQAWVEVVDRARAETLAALAALARASRANVP